MTHAFCPKCKEYSVLDDGYCQVCEIDWGKIIGERK